MWPSTLALPLPVVKSALGLCRLCSDTVRPATREVLTPALSLPAAVSSGGSYLLTSFWGSSRRKSSEGHLLCSRVQGKAGTGELE